MTSKLIMADMSLWTPNGSFFLCRFDDEQPDPVSQAAARVGH